MLGAIHRVVQDAQHVEGLRFSWIDAKHDEVPAFAALACNVQCHQTANDVIARTRARDGWSGRECLQGE